jgi:hypothetical protein
MHVYEVWNKNKDNLVSSSQAIFWKPSLWRVHLNYNFREFTTFKKVTLSLAMTSALVSFGTYVHIQNGALTDGNNKAISSSYDT